MKFFLPLTLLAVSGVSAQSTTTMTSGDGKCGADFIVSRCLETENPKALACPGTDVQCLCDAYNAVSTCFNNCPDDSRAAPAKNQADTWCRQASLLNTKTTSAPKSTSATATAEATTTATEDAKASSTSAEESKETGAAADLAANAGTLLFGVAGVVAALL